MAGEPIRKFATHNPRPLGSGRDLRSVATARQAASEATAADQRGRGERRGPERLKAERAGGLQQAIDEPASEQNFFLPREAGGMTLFLLAAFGTALVVHQGLPSTLTLSFALASAALFACGSLFAATDSAVPFPPRDTDEIIVTETASSMLGSTAAPNRICASLLT